MSIIKKKSILIKPAKDDVAEKTRGAIAYNITWE